MQRCLSPPVFLVTNHSVPGRSRAPIWSPLSRGHRPARSRRAGPMVFRILPQEFRAKAGAEGPNGKRALQGKADPIVANTGYSGHRYPQTVSDSPSGQNASGRPELKEDVLEATTDNSRRVLEHITQARGRNEFRVPLALRRRINLPPKMLDSLRRKC